MDFKLPASGALTRNSLNLRIFGENSLLLFKYPNEKLLISLDYSISFFLFTEHGNKRYQLHILFSNPFKRRSEIDEFIPY